MDARAITWPVTPVIPDRVVSGERITSAHENTSVQCLADLWTDLQAVGAVSISDPSSVKGDLLVRDSAALNRLPVGANGTMLVADSGQFLGVRWATVSAASLGAVPTTRRVNAGAGLGGGGDLSADVTLTANVLSVNGRVGAVVLNSSDIAAAGGVPATRQILAGTGLTGGGDLTADRTLAVVDDTSTQRVRASKAGVFVAARREVNFTATGTAAVAVTDNGGANRVDVAITGSGILDPTAATGDLLVRNSGGVLTRIGVGTDGQVLAADSTATPLGVKWATPISGGMTDPTTTRGDLIARGASAPAARLPVGTDGQVLTADGSQSLGVKWASANQTPWTSDIDAASHKLNNAFAIGVGQAASSEGISVTTTSASGLTCNGSAPTSNGAITLVNGSAITGFLSQNSASGHADTALDNALVLRGANQGVIVQNNFGSIRIDSIGNLLFGDSISTFAEKLRVVRTSGQVGIGKTPAYALDVAGDCNVTGAFRVNGVAIGAGSQTPWTSNIDAASFKLNNVSMIGIGQNASTYCLTMNLPTVGTSAGSAAYFLECLSATPNADFLNAILYRITAGGGWGNCSYRFGRWVDASEIATIDFGAGLLDFRTGGAARVRVTNGGLISGGYLSASSGSFADPVCPLQVIRGTVGSNGNWYDPANYAGFIHNGTNGASCYGLLVTNYWRSSENYLFAVDGRSLVDGSTTNDVHTPFFIVRGDGQMGFGSLPQAPSRYTFEGGAVELKSGYPLNLRPPNNAWDFGFRAVAASAGYSLQFGTASFGTIGMAYGHNGYLGIGPQFATITPSFPLHVQQATTATTIAAATGICLGEATSNTSYRMQLGYLLDAAIYKGAIQVYAGGAPSPLLLNPAGGNVGVGTMAPGVALDVVGGINASASVQAQTKFYGPNNMTGQPAVLHVTEQTVMSANQPNQSISFNINTSGNQVYIFVKYANGSTKTGVINIS